MSRSLSPKKNESKRWVQQGVSLATVGLILSTCFLLSGGLFSSLSLGAPSSAEPPACGEIFSLEDRVLIRSSQ